MKAASQNTPFPRKLFELIETEPNDLIEWSEHGACFFIRDVDAFCAIVLPKYFRHTKLTSFQRQLNLYGFRRITKGPDTGGYYHPTFLRHEPDEIDNIKRMVRKGERDIAPTPPYVYPKSARGSSSRGNDDDDDDDDSVGSPYKHRYTTTSSRRARSRGSSSQSITRERAVEAAPLASDRAPSMRSRTDVGSSNSGGVKSKLTGGRRGGAKASSSNSLKGSAPRGAQQQRRKRKLKQPERPAPSIADYGISPTSPYSFPDTTANRVSPPSQTKIGRNHELDDESLEGEPYSSNRSLTHTDDDDDDDADDFIQDAVVQSYAAPRRLQPPQLPASFAGYGPTAQFHWQPPEPPVTSSGRPLAIPPLDRAHSSVSTDESWASQQSRSAPATSVLFMNQHIPESPRMLSPRHNSGFDCTPASYTCGATYFGNQEQPLSTAPVGIPNTKSGHSDLWTSDELGGASKLTRENSQDWHFGGDSSMDAPWNISGLDPIDTLLDMDFPMDDVDTIGPV